MKDIYISRIDLEFVICKDWNSFRLSYSKNKLLYLVLVIIIVVLSLSTFSFLRISLIFVFNYFNPFVPNSSFLYPLKTSENRKVLWCFQGVEKGFIGNEWVSSCRCNNMFGNLDSIKRKWKKLWLYTRLWPSCPCKG